MTTEVISPSIEPLHKSPTTGNFWFSCLLQYLYIIVSHTPSGKRPGLLYPIPPGKRPFQVVHVDHLEPFDSFETSTSNNKYLLVIADNLAKYVHLYPCGTIETADVVRLLKKIWNHLGIPDRIISDRSTYFTSRTFYQFCLERRIAHSTLNSTTSSS